MLQSRAGVLPGKEFIQWLFLCRSTLISAWMKPTTCFNTQVCGVVCAPEALATVQACVARLDAKPWLLLNAEPAKAPGQAPGRAPVALTGLADLAAAWRGGAVGTGVGAGTPEASCVFIDTSGTTGFPKGVMHCQRSLLTAGEGFVARMHLQPHDRLLCVLPMFPVNAIFYSFSGALAAGATLIEGYGMSEVPGALNNPFLGPHKVGSMG